MPDSSITRINPQAHWSDAVVHGHTAFFVEVPDSGTDIEGQTRALLALAEATLIAPLDILYGHRPPMARGNLYMAHRCGFTQKVLTGTLQAAGFAAIAMRRREHPYYDLWAVANRQAMDETALRALTQAHFP